MNTIPYQVTLPPQTTYTESIPDGLVRAPAGNPTSPPLAYEPASLDTPIILSDGTVDTGEALGKGVMESFYPSTTNAKKREDAHEAFVKGASLEELAQKFEVEENVVCYWAIHGRWLDERRLLLRAKEEQDALMLSAIRIEKRQTILQKQLKTADKLRTQIDDAVNNNTDHTPSQIKLLTEGAKLIADVEVRAIGICDSGAVAESAASGAKADKTGKQPLVVVFAGGHLPPVTRVANFKQ